MVKKTPSPLGHAQSGWGDRGTPDQERRAQLDPALARGSLERAFELFDIRQDRAGLLLAWAGVVDCIFYL